MIARHAGEMRSNHKEIYSNDVILLKMCNMSFGSSPSKRDITEKQDLERVSCCWRSLNMQWCHDWRWSQIYATTQNVKSNETNALLRNDRWAQRKLHTVLVSSESIEQFGKYLLELTTQNCILEWKHTRVIPQLRFWCYTSRYKARKEIYGVGRQHPQRSLGLWSPHYNL